MNKLISANTELGFWHSLVMIGQKNSHILLVEDLEAFLVYALLKNACNTDLSSIVIAQEFLSILENPGLKQADQRNKQYLVEACLIYAGLFPGRHIKKNVGQTYFQDMGAMISYQLSINYQKTGSILLAQLYHLVAESFNKLTVILNSCK